MSKLYSDKILSELATKQLHHIPYDKRLHYNDFRRIAKHITTSIFNKEKCCLWSGYITNEKNANKGMYVNFYFKGRKVALHRLLYCNYVTPLKSDEYLKFNCANKGKCCNVHHVQKFKYNIKNVSNLETSDKTVDENSKKVVHDKSYFRIIFD